MKIPVKKKRQPRQIKQDELIKIRRFFHKKQNEICPVLGIKIPFGDTVVDHSHKANAKNLGTNDGTYIRGVIHRGANTIEGKITNGFIRAGLHKMNVSLPDMLRRLADFIEAPPMAHLKYIHPKEAPKAKFLKKTCINKLVKLFKEKYPQRKIPEVLIYKQKKNRVGNMVDKQKRLTTGLEKLFFEFDIEPDFKK